jgi:Cu-Zn family superoxide dismutase
MSRSMTVSALLITALLVGCGMTNESKTTKAAVMQDITKVAVAELKPSKAATTQPANNNVTGTVTFAELPDGKVKIVAHVMGLAPNTKHGFHIHEKGDLDSPDLMSTGGHYNPDKHIHGGPTTSPVHAGDFGNLESDANGHAMLELTVDDISIGGKERHPRQGRHRPWQRG